MKMNSGAKFAFVCSRRSALTLIEVMIATTITLLMMLALAQGFKTLSQTVSEGRSKLILSDQLRGLSTLLRNDLEGCTTTSDTPQSVLSATGYFKYYDGPISDSTATLFNHLPLTPEVESQLSASRWGDIDDILMFTARAKPGQVFRGKVPWALLIIDKINDELERGNTWDPRDQIANWNAADADGATGWTKAWKTDVTISSETAEIVWFMLPLNELNSIDPTNSINSVFDTPTGVDLNGDGAPDSDGMPDRIALCRRVLLIRPDLNISATSTMFANNIVVAGDYLTMQPLVPSTATGSEGTFRLMMQYPYQRCDLSVRPHVIIEGNNKYFTNKCNSIEDLQLPENRFAHYVFPIGGLATTLPQLALTTESGAAQYSAMTDPTFQNIGVTVNGKLIDRGFMPPCFMRTKPTISSLPAIPLLEEIVASNVVAFDLKGFDTSVKQLANPGADGIWGYDGTIAQAGWPGTDDLSLTPSDPGYALQLDLINTAYINGQVPNLFERQSASGAYVDAGWGSKLVNSTHHRIGAPDVRLSTAANLAGVTKYFATSLSLLDLNTDLDANLNARGLAMAASVRESGSYIDSTVYQSYQPAFDTFTNAYEFDGEALVQVPQTLPPRLGIYNLMWKGGLRRFGFAVAPGDPDIGTDGIGDDALEREASPPIPYKMPSIQANIRVMDNKAGTLQQISVVHDLTN
ncbi:MAG: prepilin-type N-terminal cleavage/methylation domain-containing protein [Planctomycetota bacterium]|nr:prepilin-type N-terminal cleavage/methylation domain-containing protein [Planctomycetota bacterium]